MASSFYKGQISSRVKGQTTCFHHKGRQLDLYCEECQELACTKCLSSVHRSHTMCDLSEITSIKKQDMQAFINKTEKVDLVQIDKFIASTDTLIKDNASTFEKLSKQLKKNTKKLIQSLNQLSAQTLTLYQQMEEDNTKLLQTYKQDLEMYSTQLKQQVQECKAVLQRGSNIQIYDTGCEIQSSATLPVKPTLGSARFTPNQNPQGNLKQAMGTVHISGQDKSQDSLGQDQMFSGKMPYSRSSPLSSGCKSSGTTKGGIIGKLKRLSNPGYDLLSQTKVLSEWDTPCYVTSVCPNTNGQAWITNCDSDTLTFLDKKGNVIQEVQHNTKTTDISLSPTTNTLWVCDRENNITELVSGELVHRFSTTNGPQCICITASNHVIVGMAKQISKFTSEGALVLTTGTAETGKPLVCTPYRISECPVTQNVAVADMGSKIHGRKEKPCVVVMDSKLRKLFVYDGGIQHIDQPKCQSEGERFYPYGVVYDRLGNLVIADLNNSGVLLISGRGQFIRVIYTGKYCTYAVGVDTKGVVWALFGGFYVKLLQYLQ